LQERLLLTFWLLQEVVEAVVILVVERVRVDIEHRLEHQAVALPQNLNLLLL
jgi:hypothetical protein